MIHELGQKHIQLPGYNDNAFSYAFHASLVTWFKRIHQFPSG